YFERFSAQFPDVHAFADAEEEEILRLWQGLGYYSRARNMHKAAKQVMDQFQGDFPTQYEALLSLKGVGEYTAADISCCAANEPRAVLDGNVFRVLARIFGLNIPINATEGKKTVRSLSNEYLAMDNPGEY